MSNVKHPSIKSAGVATITYSEKKYAVVGYDEVRYCHYKVEVTFPESKDDVTAYAYFGWSARLVARRIVKEYLDDKRVFALPEIVAVINL